MPLLVQKGLQFRSASVRNACITTLSAVVAAAAPADIAPQLAPLVSGLLEALSSLESSAMGQLEMEVARRGMDVNMLDEKRVQLANRSPLQVRCAPQLGTFRSKYSGYFRTVSWMSDQWYVIERF